jgi:hypothetical protein
MPLNFTPVFNSTLDIVHVNLTYQQAVQPPLMTTPEMLFFTASLGVILLVISVATKLEMCSDITGIMALPFLFVSAIQSFAVDTVTGTGVASSCVQSISGSCLSTEWALIESHTIYHYDFFGVIMAILFVISLANLYRLWLDYRKVTQQEHIGKGPSSLNDDASENTVDDHHGYPGGPIEDDNQRPRKRG